MRPRYITATRAQNQRITARSWLTNRKPRPRRACNAFSRRQDLRLHGDVQRGDRLVRHQQFRFQNQGARNSDPLALPAAEGVRQAAERGGVQPNLLDRRCGSRTGCSAAGQPVHHQWLD